MIEVEIEDPAWSDAVADVESLVRRAAAAALQASTGVIVILLTDDDVVRDLNARFLGKDAATNVLSFPAPPPPGLGPAPLGDIALAYGVCAGEAADQGKSLADHLSHLVVHGVLHLLGHDHEDDGQADAMEALERHLLAPLGVADPYQDAAATEGPI